MNRLRDTLKALGWAVGASAVCLLLAASGAIHGLAPHLAPLAVAPVLAFFYHRSRRIVGLVIGWECLFATAAVLWLLWAFRDFQFRAIQG
jgi:hypothetical protein